MNGQVIIENELEVTIKRIKQWHTYDGLLEGLPTTKMNNKILSDVKDDAKRFCNIHEIHIIEPQQKVIAYEGRYPFGDPAELPGVTCIAELWYFFPFRDKTKDFSSLGIVWFQNDYAFPIDPEVLKEIRAIPFSKICGEFNY